MGVDSLPKTVTRQRRDCDLNPGPSAPESSTLTTRLPSRPEIILSEGKERKCADTAGTVPVPCAGHFQWQNINIFFKYNTEAILSNSTRRLLWFEITKMPIAV